MRANAEVVGHIIRLPTQRIVKKMFCAKVSKKQNDLRKWKRTYVNALLVSTFFVDLLNDDNKIKDAFLVAGNEYREHHFSVLCSLINISPKMFLITKIY